MTDGITEIDGQFMEEQIIEKAKEVRVLGIRGTGYEGDILDLIVDGELYFILIREILKPNQADIQHLLPKEDKK
jgi:hypothetical protein